MPLKHILQMYWPSNFDITKFLTFHLLNNSQQIINTSKIEIMKMWCYAWHRIKTIIERSIISM